MHLFIDHTTSYHFDAKIDYGLQQLRLTPKAREGLQIIDWEIQVDGGYKELAFDDNHANHVDLISIDRGQDSVHIHVKGEVKTENETGIVGQHRGFMALWMFLQPTLLTMPGPKIRALVKELGQDHENDLLRAHALSALIARHVAYRFGETNAETVAEDAVGIGAGVCQDHAHIFIAAMRSMGHPARYVSGYLMLNDRIQQDATHAWAEAHFPDIGWVGFDISNGYSPDSRYVPVATGLDYREASPISGMRFGASNENMVVQLQVQQ